MQVIGVGLMVLSAKLLLDKEWVLLSRLLVLGPELQRAYYPPFFYAALGLGCVGLAACSVAMLGCWSGCQKSKPLVATVCTHQPFIPLLFFFIHGNLNVSEKCCNF
jgi:hypothetical protein